MLRVGPRLARRRWAAIACMCLCACASPSSNSLPTEQSSQTSQPAFVGKTWIASDSFAAPGTLRIFLGDGTLVMDSCFETYRLAKWRALDDRRIEWQEDSARIEAEITHPSPERLLLRLQLKNEVREEQYRLAQVPFVCPDMPRQQPGQATIQAAGRLIYLERLALPPSAIVRVELRDTSRADASARTLASQTIPTSQGPPFAFSLTAPRAGIDPRATVSVFAEIRDGRRLMFITDTRYPVPHEGADGMECASASSPAPPVTKRPES